MVTKKDLRQRLEILEIHFTQLEGDLLDTQQQLAVISARKEPKHDHRKKKHTKLWRDNQSKKMKAYWRKKKAGKL